jgi:hypothetical protein
MAATAALHAHQETVSAGAADLGRLIGALHSDSSGEKSRCCGCSMVGTRWSGPPPEGVWQPRSLGRGHRPAGLKRPHFPQLRPHCGHRSGASGRRDRSPAEPENPRLQQKAPAWSMSRLE